MKKWKVFFFVFLLLILAQTLVFADGDENSGNDSDGSSTVTFGEFYFNDSTIDNSNLIVDVYQQTTVGSSLLYHGVLSGYDSGSWIHFDFDKFGMIGSFNWNSTSSLGV